VSPALVGVVVALLALAARGGALAHRGALRTPDARAPAPREEGAVVDVMLAAVAASLRAGAPPAHAWARAGVLATPDGVPHARSLAARLAPRAAPAQAGGQPDARGARLGARAGGTARTRVVPGLAGRGPLRDGRAARDRRAQVAALVAASRVAVRLGAPLADTLEHVGREAVAAEARAARRRAALAGPRATARLLVVLPLLGVVVATALGADPVSSVRGGGLGATSVVLGLVALGAGRRWITLLVRRAERA